MHRTFLALAVLLGLSHADQVAYVANGHVVSYAGDLVRQAGKVAHLCEPCGETRCRTESVHTTQVRKVDADYYQLSINGEPVDMAYVFVWRNGRFVNLAALAKLHAVNVSTTLEAGRCGE